MTFDFKRHLIKVQGGRSYLPVSARIVWFRQEHPDWSIETEAVEINHEKQYAIFRARICDGDGKLMATGTKKEDVKGFGDYIEKSETGAVGRALALCGFGTQFSPELDESTGGRFADSPQPMGGGGRFGGGSSGGNFGGSGGGGNGYSGGGAARYGTPPRESSPPPRDSAPPRDSSPVRESNDAPRNDSPRNDAPRAEAPRPQPPRPAPSVATADEGEDDFEPLIGSGGLMDATEDDPFGDDAPSDSPPAIVKLAAAPSTNQAAPQGPSGTPACVSCGKALTKAQMELSVRNYGEAFCPGCQREKTRRPTLAER
ncbi:MAG: hypothetical protein ACRYFS_01180 [Janthinobacterium lividum]